MLSAVPPVLIYFFKTALTLQLQKGGVSVFGDWIADVQKNGAERMEENKEKNDEINQEEFIELCLADDNFRSLVLSFWPENVKDFISKKI